MIPSMLIGLDVCSGMLGMVLIELVRKLFVEIIWSMSLELLLLLVLK